ncbi:hypothetical protein JHN63_20245 [Streptomyces sp. MBT65]|uniref:hypothetical protein n=1 Tax=Streptomyces sp. MBT65 TaxID=1488395 RepID=UPI00190A823D|nr:hypothetical protein [Streptomyces sp. MBT65]MBK3576106.1 hypothetical protein [Streptomyces sp. MBT65]
MSAIEFHPLTFVDEADGVVVGRSDIQSYAVLPDDGAALLRRLAEGMALDEAAGWYLTEFGESVDIGDFIETLRELGFVKDDIEDIREDVEKGGAEPGPEKSVRPLRFRRLGGWAFSPPAWVAYTALVTACVTLLVTEPRLRPHTANVFFSPSLVLVQVSLALAQVPAVSWHEFFHVLAGRRLGLPTSLTMSRRLIYLVVETHLDALYSVPRRKRYLPFLAGMLADVLLFSALTVLAATGPSWAGGPALAVAYTIVLRLVWQFYLFLRTDLYYVVTTLLGCTALHEATSAYLRGRLRRLPGVRPPDEVDDSAWSPRDRLMAPWFALLTICGGGFLLATAALAVVPLLWGFATRLGPQLAHGTAGGAGFWDSIVSLVLFFGDFALLLVVSRREAARNRKHRR